jgi:anti-anti-sigma regulatory factor
VADIDKLLDHCEPEISLDRVICDLSDLEAVSSGLIAGLVVLSKRIRSAGGRLIVCGMHGGVRDVFSRLHLDRALEIADDQGQAAALLDGTLTTAGIGL